MHADRLLVPLLVLATLAIDLAFVNLLADDTVWPATMAAVIMGLAAGQINLATLWGVLGAGCLPWRLAVLLVVPVGWGVVIARSAPRIQAGYDLAAVWGVHLLTQTVLLVSILALVRLCGAVLMPANQRPVPDTGPLRRQFTVRYLFAWLTSTAIAMSVLKTAFDRARLDGFDFHWIEIVILNLVGAMIGLACVWLTVDSRGRKARLAATLVTALPAAPVVAAMPLLVHSAAVLKAVLLLWLVAALYSALACIVLRMAGLRLIWSTRKSAG